MPKENAKSQRSTKSSGRVRGAVPQWPIENRLMYHLSECAMHLSMIKQILEDADTYDGKLPEHVVQTGKRLKVIYKICAKLYPKMLKQP